MNDAVELTAQLLARRVGLRLDPAIRGRLASAVRDEAARFGDEPRRYVDRVRDDPTALQALLNRVTVQETAFFRDPAQFDAFADHVLPTLRSSQPVRVWSAGCANGQEAYSLAMVLAEADVAFEIVASDISTNALGRTAAGRYATRELGGLSPERRRRHLIPVDGEAERWEVVPDLRRHVTTVRHNIASDPLPRAAAGSQVVFCRNVLIYFGHDVVEQFLQKVATMLPPGGPLFLGYSESLAHLSTTFELERLGAAFIYRNGSARRAVSRAVPEPRSAAPLPAPRRPVPAPPARSPQPDATTPPSMEALLVEGETAMREGDHGRAVRAFRRAAYLEPDHPVAHLSLGLALDAMGDAAAARRAYAAARAAMDRGEGAGDDLVDGYGRDELTRMLDAKVRGR